MSEVSADTLVFYTIYSFLRKVLQEKKGMKKMQSVLREVMRRHGTHDEAGGSRYTGREVVWGGIQDLEKIWVTG